VLRKILNQKDRVYILQDFIESVLQIDIMKIELNSYLEKEKKHLPKEESFGIADVRVTLRNGKEFNIGIQVLDGENIQSKLLMYYTQLHFFQLKHSLKRSFTKTITINLLDFNYFDSKEYHKKVIVSPKNDKNLNNEIEMHIIEFKKFFINKKYNISKKEAWMLYLKEDVLGNGEEFDKINVLDKLVIDYWKKENME